MKFLIRQIIGAPGDTPLVKVIKETHEVVRSVVLENSRLMHHAEMRKALTAMVLERHPLTADSIFTASVEHHRQPFHVPSLSEMQSMASKLAAT